MPAVDRISLGLCESFGYKRRAAHHFIDAQFPAAHVVLVDREAHSHFVAGLVVGALLFGALGVFVGYEVAEGETPVLIVRNLTDTEVTQLVVHSDRADFRSIGKLPARASRRVMLSKGDQSVWLMGSTTTGKLPESEHVYVTTGVRVSGSVFADAITCETTL